MCDAKTHRLFGAYAGAGLAYATHQPLPAVVAAAGIAALFAGGRLSPDVDQFKGWRRLDKWLPDELLGHGGPLGHRRLSHWWGIPAAAGAALFAAHAVAPGPGWLVWVWLAAVAALAGWVSHLAADWVFGKACWQDGRGPGIPLAPWWAHHGLGLDSGGATEMVMRWALSVAPVALIWRAL